MCPGQAIEVGVVCGQQGEGRVCAVKVLCVDGLVDGVGVAGEVAALVGGKDAACVCMDGEQQRGPGM